MTRTTRIAALILFGYGQITLFGQGTVILSNRWGSHAIPTRAQNVVLDTGHAQLWAGENKIALRAVENTTVDGESPTEYFIGPGFFNGGVVTIPNIPQGRLVYLQIRAWPYQYATFADVTNSPGAIYFESNVFTNTTGAGISLPVPPVALTNFVLKHITTTTSLTVRATGAHGNELSLLVEADIGTSVTLQTTTNFTRWNTVTQSVSMNGQISFIIVIDNTVTRFYRAKVP